MDQLSQADDLTGHYLRGWLQKQKRHPLGAVFVAHTRRTLRALIILQTYLPGTSVRGMFSALGGFGRNLPCAELRIRPSGRPSWRR